jgi:threonine-phosphate decarboxylase
VTGHGGNIHGVALELGVPSSGVLDLSASINPLGVPRSVKRAIMQGIASLRHYPDPDVKALRSRIAGSIGVDPASVICGNGSTELIYAVVKALRPRRVLVPAPAFSEYERACRVHSDAVVIHLPLMRDVDFDIGADEFIRAMEGCDLAFLCNPNNPTGRLVPEGDLMRIAAAARDVRCYFILDEAFIDFMPGKSLVRQVAEHPRLIVLRSMTKFYALAGLRLGYGVFPGDVTARMLGVKEPWTVNTLAQLAGIAALDDTDYAAESLLVMEEAKHYVEKELGRLGIGFIPSPANFYLLRMDDAPAVTSSLRRAGIMVRDCSNFKGLDHRYIRIAVKSLRDMRRFFRELERCRDL